MQILHNNNTCDLIVHYQLHNPVSPFAFTHSVLVLPFPRPEIVHDQQSSSNWGIGVPDLTEHVTSGAPPELDTKHAWHRMAPEAFVSVLVYHALGYGRLGQQEHERWNNFDNLARPRIVPRPLVCYRPLLSQWSIEQGVLKRSHFWKQSQP